MTRQKKLLAVKFAVVLAIIPVAIRAYEYGPDPRYTGAPGDNKTACIAGGCHVGTFNTGSGSVKIIAAGGTTYTPGVAQKIQVVVTDSSKQKFGFQLTARLASNLTNGQAGDFSTTDNLTQIICEDSSIKANGKSCPSAFPVQFPEHSLSGYNASTSGTYTYSFNWTPPATNVGNVTLYAAGNGGPGGAPVSSGAAVYTTSLTLTPAAAQTVPAITSVNPIYSSSTTIQPGSWVSIYGTNLSSTTRIWNAATEIVNGALPTSLDGVSVTINGKNAYTYFISPTQINVQAPDDTAAGPVSVVVKNSLGTSNTGTVTLASTSPAFFLLDAKYAIGVILTATGAFGNYDLMSPAGRFSYTTRPVKRGETMLMYGVGFGPTTPSVPAGQVYAGAAATTNNVTITIGGVPQTVQFAGITAAGQYQFNVLVPSNTPTGDQLIVATVNGLQTQTGIYASVQ